jgi:Zn-finger nucleic acid-binding protein
MSKPQGLACPRCTALQLAPITVPPGIPMHECTKCRGLLISPSAWTQLFDLVAAGQSVGVGRFVPLKPGEAAPPLLMLVHCPGCNVEMDRAAFAARSRVIIDVCTAHGVWLDAAELAPILLHFQRLEKGEIEEEPSSTRSVEAQMLLREIKLAEDDWDRKVEELKTEGTTSRPWGSRVSLGLPSPNQRLRDLYTRLAVVRAAERAAIDRAAAAAAGEPEPGA